jgi:hypothetical protein
VQASYPGVRDNSRCERAMEDYNNYFPIMDSDTSSLPWLKKDIKKYLPLCQNATEKIKNIDLDEYFGKIIRDDYIDSKLYVLIYPCVKLAQLVNEYDVIANHRGREVRIFIEAEKYSLKFCQPDGVDNPDKKIV